MLNLILSIKISDRPPHQVSRLFELLAIISTLEVFELSQNTHYLNLATNYLNATNILNYLKLLISQLPNDYLNRSILLSQTIISKWSLSQTIISSSHYLNCPFIISNARQFSIISKYSLSQLNSPLWGGADGL